MDDFGHLTHRQQLHRVRIAADDALEQLGVCHADLRLVNHDFNTTYRVTMTDGQVAALRINLNSAGGVAEVEAEVAWVDALDNQAEFDVPRPRFGPSGQASVPVQIRGLDGVRPAVLFSWLRGSNVGDRSIRAAYRAIGVAMAAMHDHTATGFGATSRPHLNRLLLTDPELYAIDHPAVDQPSQNFLADLMDDLGRILAPVFTGPTQLIHADLHGANVKWHQGRLAVFDFDDCGIGAPLQDLAISTFYVRDEPALEAALFDGYSSRRPLPEHTADQFEALVANRNLHLLNYVLGSVTAEMVDFAGPYVERSVARLRDYADTGRFRLNID